MAYIDVDKKIKEIVLRIKSTKKLIENRPYDEEAKLILREHEFCLEEIKKAPKIDAVEVVHCKECKSGICTNDRYMCKRNAIYDNISKEFHGLCAVEEDHFCSYGEKRCNK